MGGTKGVLTEFPLEVCLGAFCLSGDQRHEVKRARWNLARGYRGAHYKIDSGLAEWCNG